MQKLFFSVFFLSGLFGSLLFGQINWTAKTDILAADVTALYIDSSGYMLAGTGSGVLYKSTDNGSSWNFVMYQKVPITTIIKSPSGKLFAATMGRGVYSSDNAGATWYKDQQPFGSSNIKTLLVAPDGNILVGTFNKGIYRTENNGFTWLNVIDNSLNIQDMISLPGGFVLAATYGTGIYRSLDSGKSFQQIPASMQLTSKFALTANGSLLASSNLGIYRSSDNGNNWTQIRNADGFSFVGSASAGTVTLFGYGYYGVYKSLDNGVTLSPSNTGISDTIVNCIAKNPVNGEIFVGSKFGISSSTNAGVTWQKKIAGLNGLNVGCIASSPDGNKIFVYSFGRVFRSTNAGISFTQLTSFPAVNVTHISTASPNILCVNNNVVLVATLFQIFRSTNGGDTWTLTNADESNYTGIFLQLDSVNVLMGSGTLNTYYKSTNAGQSWNKVTIGNPNLKFTSFFKGSSGVLFGAYLTKLYKSTNNSTNWVQAGAGLPLLGTLWDIKILPGAVLLASTTSGLYKSTDNGNNWILVSTPAFNNANISALLITGSGSIIVGVENGVFVSNDSGVTWVLENIGLLSTQVFTIIQAGNGTLFCGTTATGVYSAQLSTAVSSEDFGPEIFAVSDAYPNPFNPATQLSFTLTTAAHVTVKVYSTTGNEILTLLNEFTEKGNHTIEFIATNLVSGTYFISLQIGNKTIVKKVQLLK